MPQKVRKVHSENSAAINMRPLDVTEKKAARLLSVSRKTLYREAKSRCVQRYYFGNTGSFRYRLSEIEALMEAR
jgi:hypothetical protein